MRVQTTLRHPAAEGVVMSPIAPHILCWTPRVLGMAFAAFLTLFATDALTLPGDAAHKALALLMHLLPTLAVLAALAAAWRREWLAALILPLLAILHATWAWGRLHWSAYAVIDGPLLLLAALFWAAWRSRAAAGQRSR